MNQQQIKFIWPIALVVITAFLMMIGIVGGFIDPKILMIWRKVQIEKESLILGVLVALAFASGMILYHKNLPSIEQRKTISVEGMFLD